AAEDDDIVFEFAADGAAGSSAHEPPLSLDNLPVVTEPGKMAGPTSTRTSPRPPQTGISPPKTAGQPPAATTPTTAAPPPVPPPTSTSTSKYGRFE
ncbi:MAG: hypothetical protein CVU63_15145, partial [Deltaproteobacteria bacterium HGW-Deltaproteobacteria-20]